VRVIDEQHGPARFDKDVRVLMQEHVRAVVPRKTTVFVKPAFGLFSKLVVCTVE
jgi:hypothetical protein